MLRDKPINELRAIAQGYGVAISFDMDAAQLVQAIEVRQGSMQPAVETIVHRNEYDGRLFDDAPPVTEQELLDYLQPNIEAGLHVTFLDPDAWHFKFNVKEDTGTMYQPLRVILQKADAIVK